MILGIADYVVLGVVAVAVVLAIIYVKKHGAGCSGDCSQCDHCHKTPPDCHKAPPEK